MKNILAGIKIMLEISLPLDNDHLYKFFYLVYPKNDVFHMIMSSKLFVIQIWDHALIGHKIVLSKQTHSGYQGNLHITTE